jgi:RNA polymerase sigma-70 factor (ECF subfamily)
VLSLDTAGVEAQVDRAVVGCQSPESVFERAWAETVVKTGLERLWAEYEGDRRGALFGELRRYLSRPADRAAYSASGERLGMSADAVAMAVVRLRREYRAMVRAEVAKTVATPAEIEAEMRYLVELLAG